MLTTDKSEKTGPRFDSIRQLRRVFASLRKIEHERKKVGRRSGEGLCCGEMLCHARHALELYPSHQLGLEVRS